MTDTREVRIQRGTTLCVMLVAALLGILFVSAGPARTSTTERRAASRLTDFVDADTTTTVPPRTATASASTTSPLAATTTTTTGPGAGAGAGDANPAALPQTSEQPTASGATFTAGVNGLWEAIRQDKPELALPFFFPKSAYVQVKALNDPAADYQNRLIANYQEDIHMLHAQLGANAESAKFVGISVPDAQAVLVQPGEESNTGSYWRVYGTTMQYQVDGQTGSFPVTSLISWRGQWYVVHLGDIR